MTTSPIDAPEQLPPDEPPTEPMKPARLRPLLEIAAEIRRALLEDQGEITKRLDALDLELETKVEAYAIVMRELEAMRVAHVNLSKFYATQAAYRESDIDRLTARLDASMRLVGVDDIRTRTAHAFYRTDKAIEVNTKKFLERYRDDLERQNLLRFSEPEPNKSAIKQAMKAGEVVEFVTEVTRRSLQFK